MGSIDELRKWFRRYDNNWIDPKTGETMVICSSNSDYQPSGASERFSVNEGERLRELLDEIEDKYEREIAERGDSVIVYTKPATDEDMAEHGWVKLPVDVNGEFIHIGDMMAYEDNTKPMVVTAIVPPTVFLTEEGPCFADMCCHYHEPTVEEILIKMLEMAVGYTDAHTTVAYSAVSEYAEKLREMMNDTNEATLKYETCHCTTPDDAWCFACSACGKSFPRSELNIAHNHGEINYCPNCGAKVVD